MPYIDHGIDGLFDLLKRPLDKQEVAPAMDEYSTQETQAALCVKDFRNLAKDIVGSLYKGTRLTKAQIAGLNGWLQYASPQIAIGKENKPVERPKISIPVYSRRPVNCPSCGEQFSIDPTRFAGTRDSFVPGFVIQLAFVLKDLVTKQLRIGIIKCQECGEYAPAKRARRRYCSNRCRSRRHSRDRVRDGRAAEYMRSYRKIISERNRRRVSPQAQA